MAYFLTHRKESITRCPCTSDASSLHAACTIHIYLRRHPCMFYARCRRIKIITWHQSALSRRGIACICAHSVHIKIRCHSSKNTPSAFQEYSISIPRLCRQHSKNTPSAFHDYAISIPRIFHRHIKTMPSAIRIFTAGATCGRRVCFFPQESAIRIRFV